LPALAHPFPVVAPVVVWTPQTGGRFLFPSYGHAAELAVFSIIPFEDRDITANRQHQGEEA
jgi:hypothetical protein